jgi:hypothetical protein
LYLEMFGASTRAQGLLQHTVHVRLCPYLASRKVQLQNGTWL